MSCPNDCDHELCKRRRPKPLTAEAKTRAIEDVCLRLAHRFRVALPAEPAPAPKPTPPPRRAC